jgi:hypothetical protein
MIDLAAVTADDFTPHSGSRYRVRLAGTAEPIDLELVEVAAGGQPPPARRRPFSLVFRGPRQPWLPQSTYRLEHDAMGAFDLFLVPIAADAQGATYESVFN